MIAFAFDPGLSKFRAIRDKIRKLLKLKVFSQSESARYVPVTESVPLKQINKPWGKLK